MPYSKRNIYIYIPNLRKSNTRKIKGLVRWLSVVRMLPGKTDNPSLIPRIHDEERSDAC